MYRCITDWYVYADAGANTHRHTHTQRFIYIYMYTNIHILYIRVYSLYTHIFKVPNQINLQPSIFNLFKSRNKQSDTTTHLGKMAIPFWQGGPTNVIRPFFSTWNQQILLFFPNLRSKTFFLIVQKAFDQNKCQARAQCHSVWRETRHLRWTSTSCWTKSHFPHEVPPFFVFDIKFLITFWGGFLVLSIQNHPGP